MQTTTTQPGSIPITNTKAVTHPWLMLISRSALFLIFQGLIALILFAAGTPHAWDESARYWTFLPTLANVVTLYLLIRLFRAEGKRFWDILRFSPQTWKKDLLWFLLFSVVAMPLVDAPRVPLAALVFGDASVATDLLFRPIPAWAFALAFLFPLTMWFSELPLYFGYCMPRLFAGGSATRPHLDWIAWLIASFFLAAQHMFLPTILNGGYFLWRFGMFLPFALMTGLALKFRPALLPYFVIVHSLLDITTVLVYLMI